MAFNIIFPIYRFNGLTWIISDFSIQFCPILGFSLQRFYKVLSHRLSDTHFMLLCIGDNIIYYSAL
nr:MAG TPA: hypothetical protein [Caudoviricetes sp.]DAY11497.1 MAG TPA: hypothetical protein [Caudoviricetes sp.]